MHAAGVSPEEIEAGARRLLAQARGHQLAEIRKQLCLGQRQIAAAMGVSVARVSQIEHGEVTSIEVIALRAGGVIIGVTTSGPGQAETVRRVLELTVDGRQLVTPAQVTWEPAGPIGRPRSGRSRRGRLGGPGQGGRGQRAADPGGRTASARDR